MKGQYLIKSTDEDQHVIDGAVGKQQLHDRTWWREAGSYTIEKVGEE